MSITLDTTMSEYLLVTITTPTFIYYLESEAEHNI